jgi:hypothetical protein
MPASRNDFLFLMPKGGTVVEIGVAKGEFSRRILDATQPACLHLIDPWCRQERDDYLNDPSNWSAEEGERNFRQVAADFAREAAAGQVRIHRDFSTNVAPIFPDASLDWVFIDGLHSYEGVKADLEAFAPKIKPDGFILGHDYAKHHAAREMGFGVVEAVDDFVRDRGYAFLALTAEIYPTFVLARDAEAASARALVARILLAIPGIARIRDFPGREWTHELYFGPAGGSASVITF